MTVPAARAAFLEAFRWHDGHADVWRAFDDGPTFAAIVEGLSLPWVGAGITKVVGVESRGFLLGGAVAIRLGVGFTAVRKDGALFPGAKTYVESAADYRGQTHALSMQKTLTPDDTVLFVDDWAEKGAQALAVKTLVSPSHAIWAGISILVDQLEDSTRERLGRVTALVTADELGDPRG
jgi:adenine/guanine phosphoribosyltransferase-like PRPP-binding protein